MNNSSGLTKSFLSHSANGPKNDQKIDIVQNIWNPPHSLQRRTVYLSPKVSYKQFFPLELTSKDYLRRVFDILADGIRNMTAKLFSEIAEGFPSVTTASKTLFSDVLPLQANLFIILHNILGDISYQCGDGEPQTLLAADLMAPKMGLISPDDLIQCAETLLVCSSQILDQKIDSSRLGKFPVLFEASRTLLQCFGGNAAKTDVMKRLESSLSINPSQSKTVVDDMSDVDVALYNLSILEAQLESHASYKEQRMRTLGWTWSVEDLYQSNGADLVTGILPQSGAGNSSADQNSMPSLQGSLEVGKELIFQLESLLEPRASANASLINALVAAAKDIEQLSAEVGQENDFIEANRLATLAEAVNATVDSRARQLLDSVRHICRQAHHIASDLLRESDNCRRTNQFSRIDELEMCAKELSRSRTALRNAIQLESLLENTPLGELVRMENDTACITADSIFSVPLGGNLTIGSLVIRAGANAILESIKKWPGFTLMNTHSVSSPQAAGPFSFVGRSLDSASVDGTTQSARNCRTQLENNISQSGSRSTPPLRQNMSNNSQSGFKPSRSISPGRRPRSTSAPRNAIPSKLQANDSRQLKSSLPTTLARSNSAGRSRAMRDDSNESVVSVSSRGLSVVSRASTTNGSFSRSTPSVVGSMWDVDAVQEVRTRGAAAFAEGEELLKAMHTLCELSSAAHTKLLLRLVGFCADLVKLRTMAEFSGRMTEASRLAILCGCIEATIDADCLDPNAYGGRSRKRLDNCRDASIQAAELVSALQKISSDSHAVRDFSGQHQLDALVEEISRAKECLDLSLLDFSVVQTTQDQGSYWDSHLEDRLSSEGSEFVTADFLLKYVDAYEGHSVGSLAIVAGAGAILSDIRRHWVGLTALGGVPPQEETLSGAEGWNATFDTINFSDARSLRILGFTIQELKAAGFSDVDILTSGFPPNALRESGYDPTALREFNITGWDNALKPLRSETNVEKSALEALYHSTFGDNTTANNAEIGSRGMISRQMTIQNVLSKSQGVACNGSVQVTKLTLPNNNLKGTIPTAIGSLSNLTQLVLNGNKLGGHIPDSIGLLVNLTTLYLHDNALVGEIPVAMKGLRNLVVLRLDNNKLSGRLPSSLCQLSRLHRLVLSHNNFSGPLHSRFTDLRELQQLILTDNKFNGPIPEWIGSMLSLNTLHLDSNVFSGSIPISLEHLTNLTSLNLRNNPSLLVDNFRLQHKLHRCLIKFDKAL